MTLTWDIVVNLQTVAGRAKLVSVMHGLVVHDALGEGADGSVCWGRVSVRNRKRVATSTQEMVPWNPFMQKNNGFPKHSMNIASIDRRPRTLCLGQKQLNCW